MKKQTIELQKLIISYLTDDDQSSHWLRRFFHCYVDGNYTGAEKYRETICMIQTYRKLQAKGAKQAEKYLLKWIISNFLQFLHLEFDELSISTIQRTIVKGFKDKLDLFNSRLIEDVLEMENE